MYNCRFSVPLGGGEIWSLYVMSKQEPSSLLSSFLSPLSHCRLCFDLCFCLSLFFSFSSSCFIQILKKNFLFWNSCRLTGRSKDSIERSWLPLTFFPKVIHYITIIQFKSEETELVQHMYRVPCNFFSHVDSCSCNHDQNVEWPHDHSHLLCDTPL